MVKNIKIGKQWPSICCKYYVAFDSWIYGESCRNSWNGDQRQWNDPKIDGEPTEQ